jgi:DNA-binding protein HU-beta
MAQASDKPMTKSQLLNHLAAASDLTKQQVASVLDELANVAYQEARKQEKGFTIPGFGKLVLVNRAARTGRNPSTGETIQIPAKKVVKFRIAKAVKDALLD